jgi:hypothetical protein
MAFKFNQPYVINWNRKFTPIYLPGEAYSFYINFTDIVDDSSKLFFMLRIIKTDGTFVSDISLMSALVLSGVSYHLYIDSFTFPFIPDGEYQFMIYDTINDNEAIRSQIILVSSNCLNQTTPVSYRHNDVLYGIRYDLLPNFYNKFRLPINQIKTIDVSSDRTSYRQSSGVIRELRNSKTFRDIKITLEMFWASDEDFEGISAMLEHSDIYISGNKVIDMTQIKVEKPSEKTKMSKGTFEVIVDTENRDILDSYGEFILWGGNCFNYLTEYIEA